MVSLSPQAILISRESTDSRVVFWLSKGVPEKRASPNDGAINGGLGQGWYRQWLRPREPQKACVTLCHIIDIFPPGW